MATNKNETFGSLLTAAISYIAACEHKTTALVERELGDALGVAGKTVQRYKSGILPPADHEHNRIRILAEAIVTRRVGSLGREWLERFLHAARYPAADRLVDELCPTYAPHPRPERVYQNLPAPTYSQFVMRQQAFAEVVDGIERRSAVVLIASLGGMGKTCLAREIAACSLQDDSGVPHFDAVVWVSDRDRPGTTTFSLVLDTIAQTLDYPGFAQFTHSEKQYEVEQLLRRQRILLVVDNFETITDGVLLEWLLRLPEPSKAIITTREFRREFRNSAIMVDLKGMTNSETWELVNERLRVLKMEKLVSDQMELEPLLAVTGGNPKAITLTMGLLKYERRPLQEIVDDLYAARGDLFDDLLSHAWKLLDEAAKRVLMVSTFFIDSVSSDALSATADVQGFDFDRALERLTDLSLLDVQQTDLMREPRYSLHPLVRAFASARMAEQPDFEPGARERWVAWYKRLSKQVGFCWDDHSRLQRLDSEKETLYAAIKWCFQEGYLEDGYALVDDSIYYFFIKGPWNHEPPILQLAIVAAHHSQNFVEEAKNLTRYFKQLSLQEDVEEIKNRAERLIQLQEHVDRSDHYLYLFYYQMFAYIYQKDNVDRAQQLLEEGLQVGSDTPEKLLYSAIKMCLGVCHQLKNNRSAARRIYNEVLTYSRQYCIWQTIIAAQFYLIRLDAEDHEYDNVLNDLADVANTAEEHNERRHLMEILSFTAKLQEKLGNLSEAAQTITQVIELCGELGLPKKLVEAREELSRLEAQIAAASEE